MKTVRLLGPMEAMPFWNAGLRGKGITFERMKAVEVEDDFAEELLGKNPGNLTVAEAAPYCIPVFEIVSSAGRSADEVGGGEEVG